MRYLFILFLLCSCSYEASNPVMPLRDYTVNTGKTFYIMGDASVEDIINVINKNWKSRKQYKVIPLCGGQDLLQKISDAITNFSWVDLDLKNMCITNLPTNIFNGKNIRSIILPNSLKFIKEYALANLKQLDTIRLPILCQIESHAFENNKAIQTLILNVENYVENQTNEKGEITKFMHTNHIKDFAVQNANIKNLIIENYDIVYNNAFQGTSVINLQYNGVNPNIQNWNIKVTNLYLPKVTNYTKQGFNNLTKISLNYTNTQIP